MSLAEALLRTPDRRRANELVAERLTTVREADASAKDWLLRLGIGALGTASRVAFLTPVLRVAIRKAVRRLADAFIVGETMQTALSKGKSDPTLALCSFDVLGEGARTESDAARYFESYARAIEALRTSTPGSVHDRSGISVKLSALEPRYNLLQRERVLGRLLPRLQRLVSAAAEANIGLTIDAEEADRLDLSLDVIEALARDSSTRLWPGLGLAVQAYGRRAAYVIDWVAALARETGRKMTVRLVKGAYWDTEIKRAQERGLSEFPVFTHKAATDAHYLFCARRLFNASDVLYPQFATHNALTIASILELAPPGGQYEFQRLHGMGVVLFETVRSEIASFPPVRVYAPVGTHEDLLPYLVRRLLENGANSSFVHQFLDPEVPVEWVVRDPLAALRAQQKEKPGQKPAKIREPRRLYGSDRLNSLGTDWGESDEIQILEAAVRGSRDVRIGGGPILDGRKAGDAGVPIVSPSNTADVVGYSRDVTEAEIVAAMESGGNAQPEWDAVPAGERATMLERAADLLEERRSQFISLLVREAGKTLPDAVAEVREAADFCRYYAARAREQFGEPEVLAGPTGERNLLSLHGRGVFVCISPWNFPLAIFTGQIVAALVAGNCVVAKPAPATPLIAHAMTALLHEAGVPGPVLQLTPADGPAFGKVALVHRALAGVAFTGSTATAASINRVLAGRDGPIVPLIAETGGVNAMIVDATALPEQVVDDVVTSAFASAGQRCSALRVLYLQEEVADRVIEMLIGAMQCLKIGDPADPSTDVGPVITRAAAEKLTAHVSRMDKEAKILYSCDVGASRPAGASGPPASGQFFPPTLIELRTPDQLQTEEFGPVLHVVRYKAAGLPRILATIRKIGFGLTLGIHSRIEGLAQDVFRQVPVGNTYVNRNMIGAVVGVQPFGGQGLSGTGPKAGGPHYLLRFATERTLTINTVAIGGNVELLS
jgi:RHH-type proline utilization regulon transcriptional repressor/proline dehydrogenase/delta 1-pyrroline-5-carboxylate dehydrogenase